MLPAQSSTVPAPRATDPPSGCPGCESASARCHPSAALLGFMASSRRDGVSERHAQIIDFADFASLNWPLSIV